MFEVIAENEYGEQLKLTQTPDYTITSLDGIEPPEATINTTRNALADGSMFNSSHLNNRQVTVTLNINSPAEQNRIELYKYFKSKRAVRLYYRNESRNVYIDGHVQNMTIGYFEINEVAQIVIMCPFPYWQGAVDTTWFYTVESSFMFPFSHEEDDSTEMVMSYLRQDLVKTVYNDSDVVVGAVIRLHAYGSVTNPYIYNEDTNQTFRLLDTLASGDIVTIDTREGRKSITRQRGTTITNLIGKMEAGSSWLTLRPGDNVISYTATSGATNLRIEFEVQNLYEGV